MPEDIECNNSEQPSREQQVPQPTTPILEYIDNRTKVLFRHHGTIDRKGVQQLYIRACYKTFYVVHNHLGHFITGVIERDNSYIWHHTELGQSGEDSNLFALDKYIEANNAAPTPNATVLSEEDLFKHMASWGYMEPGDIKLIKEHDLVSVHSSNSQTEVAWMSLDEDVDVEPGLVMGQAKTGFIGDPQYNIVLVKSYTQNVYTDNKAFLRQGDLLKWLKKMIAPVKDVIAQVKSNMRMLESVKLDNEDLVKILEDLAK